MSVELDENSLEEYYLDSNGEVVQIFTINPDNESSPFSGDNEFNYDDYGRGSSTRFLDDPKKSNLVKKLDIEINETEDGLWEWIILQDGLMIKDKSKKPFAIYDEAKEDLEKALKPKSFMKSLLSKGSVEVDDLDLLNKELRDNLERIRILKNIPESRSNLYDLAQSKIEELSVEVVNLEAFIDDLENEQADFDDTYITSSLFKSIEKIARPLKSKESLERELQTTNKELNSLGSQVKAITKRFDGKAGYSPFPGEKQVLSYFNTSFSGKEYMNGTADRIRFGKLIKRSLEAIKTKEKLEKQISKLQDTHITNEDLMTLKNKPQKQKLNFRDFQEKQVEKPTAKYKKYKIKPGDTLSQIAKDHMGSWKKYKELAKINKIKNPNLIYPGHVILIPTNQNKTANTTVTANDQAFRNKLDRKFKIDNRFKTPLSNPKAEDKRKKLLRERAIKIENIYNFLTDPSYGEQLELEEKNPQFRASQNGKRYLDSIKKMIKNIDSQLEQLVSVNKRASSSVFKIAKNAIKIAQEYVDPEAQTRVGVALDLEYRSDEIKSDVMTRLDKVLYNVEEGIYTGFNGQRDDGLDNTINAIRSAFSGYDKPGQLMFIFRKGSSSKKEAVYVLDMGQLSKIQ